MFDEAKFPHDLDQEMIKASFYQHEEAFAVFSLVFRDVVDRHAPLKNIDNEVKLAKLFSIYFINALENTKTKALTSLGDSSNQQSNTNNVNKIISEYKNHPSFDLSKASLKDINKIIKTQKKIRALIIFHLN